MTVFDGSETAIRLAAFVGLLGLMMLWEWRAPRRLNTQPRGLRWFSNLGISALNRLVLLLFPLLGVGAAALAMQQHWGFFNWISAPGWIAFAGSVLVLDMVIYFQHRLFHKLPWLWRLHRMHHTDTEFDATTAVRFHPLEAVISMVIKLAAIVCLGAPVLAVLVFEVILSAVALFNHGNVRIPITADRLIRNLLVTPDMHRVHHSVYADEHNSNFGFNLSWWDHLFGTYRDQPVDGHERMRIGLDQFRSPEELRLDRMLRQPFIRSHL